jgi:hypothetical protein
MVDAPAAVLDPDRAADDLADRLRRADPVSDPGSDSMRLAVALVEMAPAAPARDGPTALARPARPAADR